MATIVKEQPPIWAAAKKVFDFDEEKTIFSWGDIIYNPGGVEVDQFLRTHEGVHEGQQEQNGGPQQWWMRYLKDPMFRAHQECQAYGAQYAHFCRVYKDKGLRKKYFDSLVHDLTSGMYKLHMTREDATVAILKSVPKPRTA